MDNKFNQPKRKIRLLSFRLRKSLTIREPGLRFVPNVTMSLFFKFLLFVFFDFKSGRKSREFIVVSRNLVVKLNALEKQTDEKCFWKSEKNHRWARRKKHDRFPLRRFHWKYSRSGLEMFTKFLDFCFGADDFNSEDSEDFPCARSLTNTRTCYKFPSHNFSCGKRVRNFTSFKRRHMTTWCETFAKFEFYGVTNINSDTCHKKREQQSSN